MPLAPRRTWAFVFGASLVLMSCSPKPDTRSEEAIMQAGLDALYTRHDPDAAAAEFRTVLAHNSTHYGATYQLAVALDQMGQKDQARPLWEKVLAMAEGYKDSNTMA